ncbi:MAG: DUF6159 family protein [Candidatus Marsarchaeota archaeon]|nr:DUF6159 family protein [Candidatus Marsarchaeota archaeon]MCL5106390.1 DUF6159 family protein [Candidatus Marsarchaeota archaeon]
MFENIINGWKIGKAVRGIVMKDKSLMMYPILSVVIALALLAAIFLVGIIAAGAVAGHSLMLIVGIILFYIAVTFSSTYISIALLIAYKKFSSGKKISIAEALSLAKPYWKNALKWAIFYSIIIMILNAIESRFRGIGRLAVGFIGSLAISAAVFFVVPVILEKNVGPIDAMKESVKTIYHQFGQTFGGFAFIDLYSAMFVVLGIIIIIASLALFGSSIILNIIFIATGIIGFALVVFGAVFAATLGQVFKLIVYDYANGRPLPKGISTQMISNASKKRKMAGSSNAGNI